jgi:hypothetical protein
LRALPSGSTGTDAVTFASLGVSYWWVLGIAIQVERSYRWAERVFLASWLGAAPPLEGLGPEARPWRAGIVFSLFYFGLVGVVCLAYVVRPARPTASHAPAASASAHRAR